MFILSLRKLFNEKEGELAARHFLVQKNDIFFLIMVKRISPGAPLRHPALSCLYRYGTSTNRTGTISTNTYY